MAADFQVRWEQLAGGDGLQGIPGYAHPIQNRFQEINLELRDEGSHCKCNAIVLSLLTALAAAGAAALIVMSGGPANLLYFVPGCVLASGTLILVVGLVVSTVRSMRAQQEIRGGITVQKQTPISFTDMRGEMAKPETQAVHIQHALGTFSDAQRLAFMESTYAAYYDDGATPSEESRKFLTACAAFPGTLEQIDFTGKNCAFAFALLEMLEVEAVNTRLLTQLSQAAGLPTTEAQSLIIGRYPSLRNKDRETALAMLGHLPVDWADHQAELDAMMETVEVPTSEAESQALARHPGALGRQIAAKDDKYSREVLSHLPRHDEIYQELLIQLMQKVSSVAPPSDSLTKTNLYALLMDHPEAFRQLIAERDRAYAIECLSHLPVDAGDSSVFESLLQKVGVPADREECEVLIRHPVALARHINAQGLAYTLAMVQHMHPEEIVGSLLDTIGKVTAVKAAVQQRSQLASYAHSPLALARLAQAITVQFTPQLISQIFAIMDEGEKIAFLKHMADHVNPQSPQQKTILETVKPCILEIFMQTPAALQSLTAQHPALLAQISRWPTLVADAAYFNQTSAGNASAAFLDVLYTTMSMPDQAVCVNYIVTAITHMKPAEAVHGHASQITIPARAGVPMALLTQTFMAKTPIVTARAILTLDAPNTDHRTQEYQYAQQIVALMDADQRVNLPQLCVGHLKSEYQPNEQASRIISWLKALTLNPQAFPDALVIQFFKTFPDEFKDYIFNKAFNNDQKKISSAVYLLQHMNEAAESVIPHVDGVFRGHTIYNQLVAALNEKINSASGAIPDTLARLAARLKRAPQANDKVVIGESAVIIAGQTWKKFNEVAETQKNNVWKATRV